MDEQSLANVPQKALEAEVSLWISYLCLPALHSGLVTYPHMGQITITACLLSFVHGVLQWVPVVLWASRGRSLHTTKHFKHMNFILTSMCLKFEHQNA